jgi:hypothetical protein
MILTTRHRWDQDDLIAGTNGVIGFRVFRINGNGQALELFELGKVRVKLVQQLANGAGFRQVNLHGRPSDNISADAKSQYIYLHK